MSRCFIRIILSITLSIFLMQNIFAIANVSDIAVVKAVRDGIVEAKKQLKTLNDLKKNAKTTKEALTGLKDAASIRQVLKNNLGGLKKLFGANKLSRPEETAIQRQSFMAQNQASPNNNSQQQIKQNIRDNLYATRKTTHAERDTIAQRRNRTIEHAAVNTLSLSGANKTKLSNIEKQINQLGKSAMRTDNIHADLQGTNKLLTAVALQLVQTNEMLSQLLELFGAAVVAGTPPISNQNINMASN